MSVTLSKLIHLFTSTEFVQEVRVCYLRQIVTWGVGPLGGTMISVPCPVCSRLHQLLLTKTQHWISHWHSTQYTFYWHSKSWLTTSDIEKGYVCACVHQMCAKAILSLSWNEIGPYSTWFMILLLLRLSRKWQHLFTNKFFCSSLCQDWFVSVPFTALIILLNPFSTIDHIKMWSGTIILD